MAVAATECKKCQGTGRFRFHDVPQGWTAVMDCRDCDQWLRNIFIQAGPDRKVMICPRCKQYWFIYKSRQAPDCDECWKESTVKTRIMLEEVPPPDGM